MNTDQGWVRRVLDEAAARLERLRRHDLADEIEHNASVGPLIMAELATAAWRVAGWPAAEHLCRRLGVGHLSQWRERDPDVVLAALRAAAGAPADDDIEVTAARARIDEFCGRVSRLFGWPSVGELDEIADEIQRRLPRLAELEAVTELRSALEQRWPLRDGAGLGDLAGDPERRADRVCWRYVAWKLSPPIPGRNIITTSGLAHLTPAGARRMAVELLAAADLHDRMTVAAEPSTVVDPGRPTEQE